MNVLCIGDVVGDAGLDFLCEELPELKRQMQIDFVIINGENSDKSGVGMSRTAAEILLQYADVITSGNHCFRRANMELYMENERLIHPANYPFTQNEAGCCLIDTGRWGTIRVLNLAGTAWMEPIDNPFTRADELLQWGEARYTIVDFHAESTAEKKALAIYLDGRVSVVFGTHTHVQTADEQILPEGTGFISDVGMTGPVVSVLGIRPQDAIARQRTHMPAHFAVADGECMLNAVLFVLDDTTGLCTKAHRINHRGYHAR